MAAVYEYVTPKRDGLVNDVSSDEWSSSDESDDYNSEDNSSEDEEDVPDGNNVDEEEFDSYWSFKVSSLKEAKLEVKKFDKNLWVKLTRKWRDGIGATVYFQCNLKRNKKFRQCPAKAKLIYNAGECEFFGSTKHIHVLLDERKPVFTKAVKDYVTEAIKLKAKPKDIKKQLQTRGLGNFTRRQVTQLKQRLKTKMALEGVIPNTGRNFGTMDLENWCLTRTTIPSTLDQPFVLHYEIGNTFPAHYAVFVTTRQLLWKLQFLNCLQVDAAHKMLVGKHKVLVAGGSDCARSFHPIMVGISSHENANAYTNLFKALKMWHPGWVPSAVMSDGASYITLAAATEFPEAKRLMCFFHMVS